MKLPSNYLYNKMDLDDREQLYLAWCQEQQLDANNESSVELFFDTIDASSTQEYQEEV